jgi:L-2-hydroxyglutarate oxidase LhgO
MPDSLALQFPARGQYYESADGDVTVPKGVVYVTQNCVFTSITNSQDPTGHLVGPTYSVGTILNGDTTQFELLSGQIYHGRP